MSLRRRLAVVLVLGLLALVIAVVTIVQVLASTDAAHEKSGEASADEGAQALVERVDPAAFNGPVDGETRRQLQTTAASVVRPVAGALGGYCLRGGAIVASAGKPRQGEKNGPRRDGPRHQLAPEVQDAVAALCEKAHAGEPARGRIEHPRGSDHISVVAIGDRAAAWFLARGQAGGGEGTAIWPFEVVLLAIVVTAIAGFTVDAMMALGRGAGELTGALVTLQDDLRAPIPRPRAQELGDIAAGLGAMATHLADARERERALSSRLGREQRLAALGRVVAGVAHEVRNPLAGMKLRLDLLARGGLDAASREDVAVCLGEIARLNRLVESLLSVSRAKTLAERQVMLGALADDRIARAAPFAERAGVRLSRTGDAVANADPDALASAVDNLLRNAIEASPRGAAVSVRIGIEAGAAVLDVEDGGPGIPEARRGELFEPFFTTKPEGTGLGLWISRLLLEAKGGSLSYERVGDRTRMRVAFPPS
jgi:signal transduction histidine kinase